MTEAPTTPTPPNHGWIVASRVLVGIQVAATLAASGLFFWLLFDPQRDRWGLLFLWIGHSAALAIGVVLGLVPSLVIDRRGSVRFGRRTRLAAICIGLLLLELGVAALLPWQAVC